MESPTIDKATKIRPLTREEIEVTVRIESEETDVSSHFEDQETVRWVRSQIRSGNEWAWCTAFVKVSWGDFAVEANIGSCSYKSEDDFRQSSGYFDDMVDDALDELNDKLQSIADAILPRLVA